MSDPEVNSSLSRLIDAATRLVDAITSFVKKMETRS